MKRIATILFVSAVIIFGGTVMGSTVMACDNPPCGGVPNLPPPSTWAGGCLDMLANGWVSLASGDGYFTASLGIENQLTGLGWTRVGYHWDPADVGLHGTQTINEGFSLTGEGYSIWSNLYSNGQIDINIW